MLDCFAAALAAADRRLRDQPDIDLVEAMQGIPLDVFGELCLSVPGQFSAIRGRLPTMASDEVQRNWTGNSGRPLLDQSLAFVRTLIALHGSRGGGRPTASASSTSAAAGAGCCG